MKKRTELSSKGMSLFLSVFLIMTGLFILLFSGKQLKSSRTAVVITSYNFSNKWNCKYHYLTGRRTGRFTAKNNNAQLIYSSHVEDGMIEFYIYDRSGSLLATLSGNNTSDTIKGIFKEGEKYRVCAIAAKAKKGRFIFKME